MDQEVCQMDSEDTDPTQQSDDKTEDLVDAVSVDDKQTPADIGPSGDNAENVPEDTNNDIDNANEMKDESDVMEVDEVVPSTDACPDLVNDEEKDAAVDDTGQTNEYTEDVTAPNVADAETEEKMDLEQDASGVHELIDGVDATEENETVDSVDKSEGNSAIKLNEKAEDEKSVVDKIEESDLGNSIETCNIDNVEGDEEPDVECSITPNQVNEESFNANDDTKSATVEQDTNDVETESNVEGSAEPQVEDNSVKAVCIEDIKEVDDSADGKQIIETTNESVSDIQSASSEVSALVDENVDSANNEDNKDDDKDDDMKKEALTQTVNTFDRNSDGDNDRIEEQPLLQTVDKAAESEQIEKNTESGEPVDDLSNDDTNTQTDASEVPEALQLDDKKEMDTDSDDKLVETDTVVSEERSDGKKDSKENQADESEDLVICDDENVELSEDKVDNIEDTEMDITENIDSDENSENNEGDEEKDTVQEAANEAQNTESGVIDTATEDSSVSETSVEQKDEGFEIGESDIKESGNVDQEIEKAPADQESSNEMETNETSTSQEVETEVTETSDDSKNVISVEDTNPEIDTETEGVENKENKSENKLSSESQSEGSQERKSLSPSDDMAGVEIKEERQSSTDEDKVSEAENGDTSNLKIVGVTSAAGVEIKENISAESSPGKGENSVKSQTKTETAESAKIEKKVLSRNGDPKTKVEREDDKVIGVKEEKKPTPKVKSSKIQTCIVCKKVVKCKYNIVRNGDVKHLCDDNCFKRFRSSPTTYLQQAETNKTGEAKPDAPNQTMENALPASTPKPVNQPTPVTPTQVYKTCTVCQLMNVRTSKPFLNWLGMDYCGEECLGKFQFGLDSNCCYCSGPIFPNNKAKFCCRVGTEVKQFCSSNCSSDFVKRMKLCAFCSKNLTQIKDSFMAPVGNQGTFKDFCSQTCLQKFEDKNNKDLEVVRVQTGQKTAKAPKGNFTCAVCSKIGPVKHEFKLDSKLNRLCSDPCFSAFQYANKLTMNTCDNCNTNLNAEVQAPQYVQFEGQQKRFCSFMCVNVFMNSNKKTVPCAWCGNKKSNFDMIERVDANNKYQLFCSLNCLSLYRVNLQASSNQSVTCDQCRKYVPAQYHLTMSDASVRNFCSYGCVMQFQQQFQMPAKQPVQQSTTTSSKTVSQMIQQQKQTTTRSGRVVTKGAKVAANEQPPPPKPQRSGKKEADSFPIISNVMSLAPQGPQQRVNVKASIPLTVTNQQQAIKATSTAGNQTVQQKIIIQPPPPVAMKNKSMLCKPITQTKATSCRPHTQSKEVQTDGKAEPDKFPVPFPVPVYCPTPLAMYSLPTPILVPVPIPIPVPIFIPTTKKSAISILKQIKEIRERIPADPLEAELLMMAEAVAGKDDDSSSSSEEEENPVPVVKETPAVPTAGGAELGEDMLQMALRMASEMSDEPVMDLETSLEPVAVNTEPPPQPKPEIPPEPVEEEDEYIPSTRTRRSRGGSKRQSRSSTRRNPKRQKIEVPQVYREPTPSPPAPTAPPPDANFHLKYTYGVNAFKHWVIHKNSLLEQTSRPGQGKSLKTFKTDILQCTADELNYALCLFVKEVRKPNGEEYAVDSVYYLCLGIQQYLFENGRIDNIFTDFYYERFTEGLNEILTRYEPKLNHAGQLVCRIEEEHLWESKQLGAHSPHVLLNSLVYFNTKYFMLKTSDDHLKLSFTHIMKHWKKTASGRGSGTGPNAGRSVYLRYYCPTPQGKVDNQKKKKEEMPVYEQTENLENPLRCPVKLYEFYLSKCPESIKSRNDTFYLQAERSSVPDSPVWYSNISVDGDRLAKLLNRIRLVREIQEAHLHTQPIYI